MNLYITIIILLLFINTVIANLNPQPIAAVTIINSTNSNYYGLFPIEILPLLSTKSICFNLTIFNELLSSLDMLDRLSIINLHVPYKIFLNYFLQPNLFPTYDRDLLIVNNTEYKQCDRLDARFTTKINVTIPKNYQFNLPIIIAFNQTLTNTVVGWEFNVSNILTGDILYIGQHYFYIKQLFINNLIEYIEFTVWAKVYKPFVNKYSGEFESGIDSTVIIPDITGAVCLETVYLLTKDLNVDDVNRLCNSNK